MRIYSNIFSAVGFIFQYIIPIILFGNVIPYTHDSLKAGLTATGYIAVAVILLVIGSKLRGKLHEKPRGLMRATLLSLFPVVCWFTVKIGINYALNLFIALAKYWEYLIIFIVIGRLFYIMSEIIYDKGDEKIK